MTSHALHYVHGHAEPVLRSHAVRTAESSAAYLLPHLRPGMSLLDVGCGPGTITVDLAVAVAPGRVLAVDPAATAVEAAAAAVAAAGTAVEVRRADVLDLSARADGRFDVVHAHQVLQHVPDPVAVLRHVGTLLAPGGVVAVRDADYSAFTWWPQVPALERWRALYLRLTRAAGGDPDAGRRLLSWARAAGFADVTATASTWCYADPAARAWWGGLWADRVVGSAIAEQAVASGEATRADLQELREGWLEWAAADDGWFLVPHGEVLARRPASLS